MMSTESSSPSSASGSSAKSSSSFYSVVSVFLVFLCVLIALLQQPEAAATKLATHNTAKLRDSAPTRINYNNNNNNHSTLANAHYFNSSSSSAHPLDYPDDRVEADSPSITSVVSRWNIMSSITENSFLQAMFWSSFLGSFVYLCSYIWSFVRHHFLARFYRSISISSKDENYLPILEYLSSVCLCEYSALMMRTQKNKKTWKERMMEYQGLNKLSLPRIEFLPSNESANVHVFTYKNQQFILTRQKGQTITTGWDRKPLDLETLTISVWGKDNTPIKNLIQDALSASIKVKNDNLNVYVTSSCSWMGGWEKALSKRPRSIDSVILDSNISDMLLSDARNFLQNGEWYAQRGIPYRRGYLLYGPPGTGKTTFCQVLASALQLDVCMLSLTNAGLDDNTLASNLRDTPMNSIILLEDVDAVFTERSKQNGKNMVTFSGLLNALDGVASQEGRLFFMTTNHIEKLDPALIRPGRCDLKVELKKASKLQLKNIFLRFFPDAVSESEEFARRIPAGEFSMAAIQAHLLENKNIDDALKNIEQLLAQCSSATKIIQTNIYDCLKYVGLEKYANIFIHHGIDTREQLLTLNLEQIKSWCFLMNYDESEKYRMKMLLEEDEEFIKEYSKTDSYTVRDSFITAYASCKVDKAVFDEMTQQFCDLTVDKHGRSIISLYQLKYILAQAFTPQQCITLANNIINSKCQSYDEIMKSATFLQRANIIQHIDMNQLSLFPTINELKSIDDKEIEKLLPDKTANKDDDDDDDKKEKKLPKHIDQARRLLSSLLKPSDSNSNLTRGIICPTRAQLMSNFLVNLHGLSTVEKHEFIDTCCDEAGVSRLSLLQLQSLFQTCFSLSKQTLSMYNDDSNKCVHDALMQQLNNMLHPTANNQHDSGDLLANTVAFNIHDSHDNSVIHDTSAPVNLQRDISSLSTASTSSNVSDVGTKAKFHGDASWLTQWLSSHDAQNPTSPPLVHYVKIFTKQHLFTQQDLMSEPRLEARDFQDLGVKKIGDQRKLAKLIKELK